MPNPTLTAGDEESRIINGNLALITGGQQGGAYWPLIKLRERLKARRGEGQVTRKVRFYYDDYDEPGAIEQFQYPGNFTTRRVNQGMASGRFGRGVLEFVVTTLAERSFGIKSLEAPGASDDAKGVLEETIKEHNRQYGFDPNEPLKD